MRDFGSFAMEERYKETVVYWEGDDGFTFDGAYGVTPPYLYVPSERIWDTVVPPWLRGRRAEVVGRLQAHSHHRLVDTDDGYAVLDGLLLSDRAAWRVLHR